MSERCIACVDMPEGEWCRACGRGLPEPAPPPEQPSWLAEAVRRARGDYNDDEIRRMWDAWQRAQRGESDVRIVEIVTDERGRVRRFTAELPEQPECDHDWRDARNEVVQSGEFCPKCKSVRAGNATTDGAR